MSKKSGFIYCLLILCAGASAQVPGQAVVAGDTIPAAPSPDSSLRIINLSTFFTQHIDSSYLYQFRINRNTPRYYWYLKNAPVGMQINKDNGTVSFTAARNYFLSGRLRYDYPYRVDLGVQSLDNPEERIDTFFSVSFYNTEIIPSKIKPSVSGTLYIDEGMPVSFRVQCETGSFPFESILFSSSVPIKDYTLVKTCNDEFNWTPGFEFVKDTDSVQVKTVMLSFTGTTKFQVKDTANVSVIVKNALDYPLANREHAQLSKSMETYILQLKYAFLQLDKQLKNTKSTRTVFDLTSATTALTGTVLNTSSSPRAQNTGKILPSVGVAVVPVKEAVMPVKTVEQNQAATIRGSIKRLEYMLADKQLTGERDPQVLAKTATLREELKQVQVQLIDIPAEITNNMTAEQLNDYFNSPRVNRKYRLKRR